MVFSLSAVFGGNTIFVLFRWRARSLQYNIHQTSCIAVLTHEETAEESF